MQRGYQRRRARVREAEVRLVSHRDLVRLARRQQGCCAYCPAVFAFKRDGLPRAHLEHIIPLSRGGWHAIGNLCWSCQVCNQRKGRRLLSEWRYGGQQRAPVRI